MELYTFILACISCILPAWGELVPHSTITLQVPGIEFHHFMHTQNEVSSCGSPGSVGGTETPAGQPMDAAHFPQCPVHTPSTALPGVQEGCCKQQPWFGPVT